MGKVSAMQTSKWPGQIATQTLHARVHHVCREHMCHGLPPGQRLHKKGCLPQRRMVPCPTWSLARAPCACDTCRRHWCRRVEAGRGQPTAARLERLHRRLAVLAAQQLHRQPKNFLPLSDQAGPPPGLVHSSKATLEARLEIATAIRPSTPGNTTAKGGVRAPFTYTQS